MDDPLAHREGSGRLGGRVAIVVGAGQSVGSGPADRTVGNGRAAAIVFAREGASVLAVDRDLGRAQETTDLITDAGGTAAALGIDIADEDEVRSLPARCGELFGPPSILHNNVGIGAGDGGVTTLDRENWDRIFEVNVTGMYLTCKHVIPVMRENGGGAIVNISSVAAVAAAPMAAYTSSKAAVNVLPVDGGQSARIG